MKISLITVCYNSAATLESTIQSVRNQTYSEIEYIIVDGNSKDESVEIIKSNSDVVSKWVSEPDSGLYDAMNKGIKMATGEVIGLINSDDFFCDKNALSKVMTQFELDSKIDCVYADLFYVSKNNTEKIVRSWKTGKRKSFKKGWHPAHPTFYVKSKIYEKYGNFNIEMKFANDFEIMLRFLEKHKITATYLPESLVKMRLGGVSNRNLKNIITQNVYNIKAFEMNGIEVNSSIYLIRRLVPKILQFFPFGN